MKILILGAGGMLGTAMVKILSAEEIIVGDLPDYDITDNQSIKEKINLAKPDILINCAAFTDVDACESEFEKAKLINGQAVGELAKICSELNIIMVHYSTDYVFDGQNYEGYKENSLTSPLNAYGRSKLIGEELLFQNSKKFYLIRTAWLYGEGGKNFVDTMLDLMNSKEEVEVVNDQFGNPTYTHDLAKASYDLLKTKAEFGIYHLVNSGSGSWYDLALKIKELKGFKTQIKPVSSTEFPRPAKRPAYSKLINTKTANLRNWTEALSEYLSLKH